MLFTINDLGFSIAGLLLEGWLAFAARCVCALALLFIGWVVSRSTKRPLRLKIRNICGDETVWGCNQWLKM